MKLPAHTKSWVSLYLHLKSLNLHEETLVRMEERHHDPLLPPTIKEFKMADIKTMALEELIQVMPPADMLSKLCSLTKGNDARSYFPDGTDAAYNTLDNLFKVLY